MTSKPYSPPKRSPLIKDSAEADCRCAEKEGEEQMTDLSTFSGQAEHYQGVTRRLWGDTPVKRIAIPAPPAVRAIPKAACQPSRLDRYKDHPDFGPAAPKWRQIVKAVCMGHDISIDVVLGSSHRIDVAPIRHECFYRIHAETNMSKNRIGAMFGRDHTTIIHGIRKHIDRAAKIGIVLPDNSIDKGKRTVEAVYRLRQAGLTNKEIAEKIGRNRDYVANIACMLAKAGMEA